MYNTEHHHVSLGLLTPADVHRGVAEARVAARATVLTAAYTAHPERFPAGLPRPPAPPGEVWINPPQSPLPFASAIGPAAVVVTACSRGCVRVACRRSLRVGGQERRWGAVQNPRR